MAYHVITWTPDNCPNLPGCIVEIAYDDELPADQHVWALHRSVQRCSAHASLNDLEIADVLLSESRRRQYTIGQIMSLVLPAKPTEEEMRQFFPKIAWSWSGKGKDRVLSLSFSDLSEAQRSQLQTWCDGQFGAGKVQMVAQMTA